MKHFLHHTYQYHSTLHNYLWLLLLVTSFTGKKSYWIPSTSLYVGTLSNIGRVNNGEKSKNWLGLSSRSPSKWMISMRTTSLLRSSMGRRVPPEPKHHSIEKFEDHEYYMFDLDSPPLNWGQIHRNFLLANQPILWLHWLVYWVN